MARNIIDWQSDPASYIVGGLLLEIGKNLVYQQHSTAKGRRVCPLAFSERFEDAPAFKGRNWHTEKGMQKRVIDPTP